MTVITARPGLGPIFVTVRSLLYMCYAPVAIDSSIIANHCRCRAYIDSECGGRGRKREEWGPREDEPPREVVRHLVRKWGEEVRMSLLARKWGGEATREEVWQTVRTVRWPARGEHVRGEKDLTDSNSVCTHACRHCSINATIIQNNYDTKPTSRKLIISMGLWRQNVRARIDVAIGAYTCNRENCMNLP